MDHAVEVVILNKENIDNEHICCAISDKKCLDGYLKKNGAFITHEILSEGKFQKVIEDIKNERYRF